MSERLDRLAKGLAGLTSRRQVLKYLAGALFLGTTGCLSRRTCLRTYCCSCSRRGPASNCLQICELCPVGEGWTLTGSCATLVCCPPGAAACGGMCTNPLTDVNNCGGCGNICLGAMPGCCGGLCTDLSTDSSNCGSCGTDCSTLGTGATCVGGACVAAASLSTTATSTSTSTSVPSIPSIPSVPGGS